jgi:hypothetical protein
MRWTVEIDEKLWKKFRADDAFSSDEEALAYILGTVLTSKRGASGGGTSTELLIVAGRIKVTPCPLSP